MRAKALLSIFIIILYSIIAASIIAAAGTTTQIQSYAQKITAPPSNLFQEILYYIAQGYNWLVGLIQNVLQNTLLKQDPQLASSYANIIAWLVPLSALYILLTFIEVARKYLGYVIAAGWLFLIVLLFLAHY